ncbi:MAG: helix-turn-helix domain-containing protein [Patescibacteria group bacterium]
MEAIEKFLKNQGFNKSDSDVYLDVAKHGQSFASSVAHRTGIDRTTVYSALKRLLKKGVIVQTKVNDVMAYMSVSPEVFLDKVERNIEDLQSEKKAAQLFVDDMLKLGKSSFLQPKIKIYEGVNAVMNLYQQTLKKGQQQKSFLTIKFIPDSLKKFLTEEFMKMKQKKGVISKVIVASSKFSSRYKALDSKSNRETRIVQDHPFELHAEIILYGTQDVAIIDFHKQIYGMVISSDTFYKTIEAMFDYIWDKN